jgi:hypothetical protein
MPVGRLDRVGALLAPRLSFSAAQNQHSPPNPGRPESIDSLVVLPEHWAVRSITHAERRLSGDNPPRLGRYCPG